MKQVGDGQRQWWIAALLLVLSGVAVVLLIGGLSQNFGPNMLADLEIYRGAISYAWAGHGLYEWVYVGHPTVSGLGFTYPPFAAVALAWVSWGSLLTVKLIWTALALICSIASVALLVRTEAGQVGRSTPTQLAWTAGLATAFLFSYPVLHDFFAGQASLFVVTLVLFDHTLPRRWRGVLIGVAAAIKLTPLVFVPYFLVTRQWRAAAVSTSTFVGASLIAAILLPRDSWDYWTLRLWQTERIGDPVVSINKSLLGLVTRMLGTGPGTTAVWLVLAVVAAAWAFWQARNAYRRSDQVEATLIIGVLSVAVSPISWPHHLVWLSLVACWWLLQRRPGFTVLGLMMFGVLMAYPAFDIVTPAYPSPPLLVELPVLAVVLALIAGTGRLRPGQGTEASAPE